MSLVRQLEDAEWDVISIVSDPILLGEFLRNTADGSPLKEEWPKQKFSYRWYQKDLLSDQSEFISLVAGRAVGKCNPIDSRIYLYPYGYMSIRDLMYRLNRMNYIPVVYSMDESRRIVQKRIRINKNGVRTVFRVTTASNHIFDGTENHPLFTPRGWIEIKDLQEDDQVAVMTHLPHASGKESFVWEELRWLGYVSGYSYLTPEMNFHLKFSAGVQEMQRIAVYFDANLRRNADGSYVLMRKRGPLPHYVRKFIAEQRLKIVTTKGLLRIPYDVKAESLDHIRIFLESFLANNAEFTNNDVTIRHNAETFIYDIQELLLRFGVESKIQQTEDGRWQLRTLDYNSYYTLFDEFDIPGVVAHNLKSPTRPIQYSQDVRFEPIVSIVNRGPMPTFAITVQDTENYICDNLLVHNSLVLEDKMIYQAVNIEEEFPSTREETLVTANVSQMTPILDRLILRLSNSYLLKDFLKGNINRSKGTLDFPLPGGSNYRINARIAGSRGENNMVGLHVPKIIGDEMQIFPMTAFTQLGPTYNGWEPKAQQFFAGVNY